MADGVAQGRLDAARFASKVDMNRVRELLLGPNGPVIRQLLKTGLRIERAAKHHAPVDTGRLRASIATRVGDDGNSVEVGTNVSYGIFQEQGTERMRAHPFLMPAVHEVLGRGIDTGD